MYNLTVSAQTQKKIMVKQDLPHAITAMNARAHALLQTHCICRVV